MTVYIWGSDEKRKVIEAQWCASTIWWELTNYIFYALTSKSLRGSDGNLDSPDFYYITLSGNNAFDLSYTKFIEQADGKKVEGNEKLYKHLTISNACRTNNSNIRFAWSWYDITSKIKINKWFTPVKLNEDKVFYIQTTNNKILSWDIIITLCIDDNCNTTKQVSKRFIDWRTQTISLRNCAYYKDDKYTCKTREGCRVYDNEDITKCLEY